MICELAVTLSMSEIAAISQRALAEKLAGQVGGVFSVLWCRIEKEIERRERPVKRKAA